MKGVSTLYSFKHRASSKSASRGVKSNHFAAVVVVLCMQGAYISEVFTPNELKSWDLQYAGGQRSSFERKKRERNDDN